MTRRAVIFDLGGVVLDSPLRFLADFERENGLPANFIAGVVGAYAGAGDGPWHRLERGELPFEAFCADFDRAIAHRGKRVSTARMMREMADYARVRPEMVAAIRRLRANGLGVAALTNNWVADDPQYRRMQGLRPEFDVFVESCKVGMRKPEPGIYHLVCEHLAVTPEAAVFLDDIGGNLKAARALGMATIKVNAPARALAELSSLLGLELAP